MKRPRRMLLAVVGLVLTALLVAMFWPADQGPSYQGKPLEYWLARCDIGDDTSPEWKRAFQAVQHIGTNGLPFLIRRIQYEPPAWRRRLLPLVPKFVWRVAPSALARALVDSREARAELAVGGFAILGVEAAPAIPVLTNLLSRPGQLDLNFRALTALTYVGTNGLAIVVGIVTNAAYPDTLRGGALENIRQLGTNATSAIPRLVTFLKDDELGPQVGATLGALALQPDVVVPALAECLRSEDSRLAVSAADALGEFGPKAATAVPALLSATTNNEPALSEAAANALLKIAPEVLKKDEH